MKDTPLKQRDPELWVIKVELMTEVITRLESALADLRPIASSSAPPVVFE